MDILLVMVNKKLTQLFIKTLRPLEHYCQLFHIIKARV